jgi:MSHA biogenesis protein MshE
VEAARANEEFKPMEDWAMEYAIEGITDLSEVFKISVDLNEKVADSG